MKNEKQKESLFLIGILPAAANYAVAVVKYKWNVYQENKKIAKLKKQILMIIPIRDFILSFLI